MMKVAHRISLILTCLLGIMAMFVLPLFSFEGYSMIKHTTSHLGAQGSPNAWLMNVVFMILGLMALWCVLTTKVRYHQVIGGFFGISLFLTGVFQHASLIESYDSNVVLDQLHSVFATMTGFSFVLLAFGHGLMHRNSQRFFGLSVGIVATVISLLMTIYIDYMGILQRIMFILSFGFVFFKMKVNFIYQYRTSK